MKGLPKTIAGQLTRVLLVILTAVLVIANASYAKPKKAKCKLPTDNIGAAYTKATESPKYYCVKTKGKKWELAKLQNGKKFYLQNNKCKNKKKGGKKKQKQKGKKLAEFKKYCKEIEKKHKNTSTTISSLGALPAVDGILNNVTKAQSLFSSAPALLAVKGTPPSMAEIANNSAETYFFSEGQVEAIANGNPDSNQCNTFWGGSQDGDPAGMSGCFMTQGVAQSFSPILSSATSTCYLREMVSPQAIASGGITLLSGSYPDNNAGSLFDTPDGDQDRLVKVNVTGFSGGRGPGDDDQGSDNGNSTQDMTVFVQVASAQKNEANDDQYSVTMWFCSQNQVTGLEQIRLKKDGTLITTMQGDEQGSKHYVRVTGKVSVTKNGFPVFDPEAERTANIQVSSDQWKLKSDIRIPGEGDEDQGLLKVKIFDVMDGERRLNYSVSNFTGSDLDTLRFLAGAVKDQSFDSQGAKKGEFSAAVEWRKTAYRSAPNSSLFSKLNEVDFDTDSFYAEEPNPNVDLSGVSCTQTPDVELKMDFSNKKIAKIAEKCEPPIDDGNFCSSGNLGTAEEMWFSVCQQNSQG